MGTLFVPIEDDASFSIQGSNYSVVANFSSDLDNVFLRTFANDASNVGFLWGVSNVTPSAPKMIVGAIRSGANSNIPQNDLTIYNGNVGVGVTNVAQYKLEVHGDINYTGDLLSKGSRLNMFALNDKVGVGTNAPAALLEVANLSAAGPALRVVQKTQITGGNGNIAEFYDNDYSSSLPVMVIADEKCVGINTTTPTQTLDVVGGNARASQFISYAASGSAPLIVASSNMVANLNVQYVGGYDSAWYQNAANLSGTLRSNVLPMTTVAAGTYASASNVATLTVDQYGRLSMASNIPIAISTGSVIGLCNVAKTADYNDLSNITFVLNGQNAVFTTGGNVGIGVNPDIGCRLHVESPGGATDTIARIKANTSSSVNVALDLMGNIKGARMSYNPADNKMYIQAMNAGVSTTYVTYNNDGSNVGIGTTVPLDTLHVQGTTRVSGSLRAGQLNADDITAGTLSSNILQTISGMVDNTVFGSASSNAIVTVDSRGRVVDISNQAIVIQRSAITDIVDPWVRTNDSIYYAVANARVGVATATPLQPLHVVGTAQFDGSIVPGTCNSFDLGSTSARFRQLYLANNAIDIEGSRIIINNLGNDMRFRTPGDTDFMNIYIRNIVATGTISATNLAQSAFTDTTVASNITSSRLPSNVLPLGTATVGTYGTLSNIPIVSVDTFGRVSSISQTTSINYNHLINRPFIVNGSGTAEYTGGSVSIGAGPSDTTSALLFNSSDTATNTNKIIFTFQPDGSRIGHSSGWNVNHYAGQSNSSSSAFRFFCSSGVTNGGYNERFTVLSNGNVGIGSATPAYTLDVVAGTGTINFNGSLVQNKTTTIVNSSGILNSNAFPVISGLVANTYGSSAAVPRITVDATGRVTSITTNALAAVAATGDYNSLSNTTFVLTGTSNATYTVANGNVGIGTNTTQAKLHVQAASGSDLLRLGVGIDQGINVTTSSGTNASGTPDYVYIGCKPALAGGVSGGSFQPFITLVNTAPRTFADVALVQNGGNVGVGTTVALADAKLHVQGIFNSTSNIRQGGADIVVNSTIVSGALPDTTVVAGAYGNASNVATFNVDQKGRITSVTAVAINNVPAANITSLCNVAKTADYDDLSNQPFIRSTSNVYYNFAGNVGIGYASPSYKLAVNGSIYCNSTVFASNLTILGETTTLNTTTSNTEQMVVDNAGTGPALFVRQTGPQPVAQFYDDTNIALMIEDGGFVGIGTTDPGYKLEVFNGSFNVKNGSLLVNNQTVVASSGTIDATALPNTTVSAGSYGTATSFPNITVDSKGRLTAASSVQLATSATTDTTNATNITSGTLNGNRLETINTITADTTFGTPSNIPILRLDNKGRVISLSNSPVLDYNSLLNRTFVLNGANAVFSTGNVGVGTATPLRTLHVQGDINYTGTLVYNNTSNLISAGIIQDVALSNLHANVATFGSGTAIPSITIDRKGRITAFTTMNVESSQWTTSNANIFIENSNVGVGTNAPNALFHVHGANMNIGTRFIRSTYSSAGLPTANGRINGVNITALNKRTKISNATAMRCIRSLVPRTISSTNYNWQSVAWSAELGIFVAVATNSSICGTSPDGIVWTERNINNSLEWVVVCWSPELGMFVALAKSSSTYATSVDGITWTTRSLPVGAWVTITWSSELGMFIVLASNSSTYITSTNGISWTSRSTLTSSSDWTAVCWSPEAALFVAIAKGSSSCETSPDGLTWTQRSLGSGIHWNSIAWSSELSLFVVVASNSSTYATSPDGITWTTRTFQTYTAWTQVYWIPELVMFVASESTNTVYAASMDGITWTYIPLSPSRSINAVCWSPDLATVVMVGSQNVCMTSIANPAPLNTILAPRSQLAIDAATGFVGIGSTAPSTRLDVAGTVKATQFIGDGSQLAGIVSFWNGVPASSNIFYTNGNVGIGTSNPQYMLHVTNDIFAYNVITYSDAKYKTDVATITGALDTVKQLRGVKYKLSTRDDDKTFMGVIAQEVETLVPEVVYTDEGGMKSVSYGNMIGLLIEAVKDMQKVIEKQSGEIAELKLALQPK